MKSSGLARVAFFRRRFVLSGYSADAAFLANQRLSDTLQMFTPVNITGSICNSSIEKKGQTERNEFGTEVTMTCSSEDIYINIVSIWGTAHFKLGRKMRYQLNPPWIGEHSLPNSLV